MLDTPYIPRGPVPHGARRSCCIQRILASKATSHWLLNAVFGALALLLQTARADSVPTHERMFERTFESGRVYSDPFNDVDIDVIFTKGGQSWRVPAFWRGGQKWTVRFAPPAAGEYEYRLSSTDPSNADLNGRNGRMRITAYRGQVELLRRGAPRVAENRRYFEYADGAPFFWFGDTWWSGLSSRLPWNGFQKLTADRKAKGFTAVQLVVGLVPPEEEAPIDPGFSNEGGPVWDAQFQRINPAYFDAADRRIEHLVNSGLVPVLVGAWRRILPTMGVPKMKQHWRYIIARYAAYPVIWLAGGEVYDPPERALVPDEHLKPVRGWTEVTSYIRSVDPYRRLLSVHESVTPFDVPIQDPALTDFDAIQTGHFGWNSVEIQVALLNMRYSRTDQIKPLVIAEFAYEKLSEDHFEDVQRAGFWLAMLNGAAGYTYGAAATVEANSVEAPFQRHARYSLRTWDEGMSFPGSQQLAYGAQLLRQIDWWTLQPRPDLVTPHGTTLLEPKDRSLGFDLGNWAPYFFSRDASVRHLDWPAGEWRQKNGTIQGPYLAASNEGNRVVYVPSFGHRRFHAIPTVIDLDDRQYRVFLFDPTLGTRIDLGAIRYRESELEQELDANEINSGCTRIHEIATQPIAPEGAPQELCIIRAVGQRDDAVVSVAMDASSDLTLILRYRDPGNYLSVAYRARATKEGFITFVERKNGVTSEPFGLTRIATLGPEAKLSAEVKGGVAVASLTDGAAVYTTPIIDVEASGAGLIGLVRNPGNQRQIDSLQVRINRSIVEHAAGDQRLYDGSGRYRGRLGTPGWSDNDHFVLLNAYRPKQLPAFVQDWVLVLESQSSIENSR